MSSSTGTMYAIDQVAREMAKIAAKMGYGYFAGSQTEASCKERAKTEGGLAWDEHAKQCWKVFGKAVDIRPDKDSIQEGFETVNFNFHATGNGGGAVPNSNALPGNTSGLGSPGWSSDSMQFNVGT